MLIGVVAHVSREHLVEELQRHTTVDIIRWDDGVPGVNGCADNHIRVLQALRRYAYWSDEWCVVLEDDARPAPDFRQQLNKALARPESPLVALYLGTGNPKGATQQAIEPAIRAAEAADSHWITADWFMSGVGYAVRASSVSDLIEFMSSNGGPADNRINDWSHHVGIQTWYTQPSLVEHADEPSIINGAHQAYDRITPRHAWRHGGRDEWLSSTVQMGYAQGWSPE